MRPGPPAALDASRARLSAVRRAAALHVDRWGEELRQVGAVTFVLDSFTGRGITGTVEDQAQTDHLASTRPFGGVLAA